MTIKSLLLIFALGLVISSSLWASTILSTQVTHEKNHYRVRFDVIIEANTKRIKTLMADYSSWPKLSNLLEEAQLLGKHEDGTDIVSLIYRTCILFFCKTLNKMEYVARQDNGDLVTMVIPEHSDFKYAKEHWHIEAQEHQTRVRYLADIQPDFYIPPLIGPLFVKAKIRAALKHTASQLESLGSTS